MAHVLVLGADGFIGSHLVEALDAAGHRVRCFDRFANGVVHNLQPSARVEVMPGDFLNRHDLDSALSDIEYVFHLVSMTTPATSGADASFDIETNVRMSVELLKLCVARRVRRVLFPSTGSVYGRDSAEPLDEDAQALPVSPYAIGKLAIEGYLRFFKRSHGLDSIAYRISNPYGERQNVTGAQGVIPIFLRRMSRGEPLDVFGAGDMLRDYVYVADLVEMLVASFEQPARREIYNVGSGHASSILELIDVLHDVTGTEPTVRHHPFRPTDVHRTVLDVSRFRDEFGVGARTDLRTGVERTWRHVSSL